MYIILKKKQLSRKNNFVLNQYLIVQNYSIVYYFFAKFLTNINFLLTSHSFFKNNAKNNTIKIFSGKSTFRSLFSTR